MLEVEILNYFVVVGLWGVCWLGWLGWLSWSRYARACPTGWWFIFSLSLFSSPAPPPSQSLSYLPPSLMTRFAFARRPNLTTPPCARSFLLAFFFVYSCSCLFSADGLTISADEAKMAEGKVDPIRHDGQLESKITEAQDSPLTPPE